MPGDAGKALRVSRYFGNDERPPQLRFSIWSGDAADAAVSLTEEEAARLAQFLAPQPAPQPRRQLFDHLRDTLRLPQPPRQGRWLRSAACAVPSSSSISTAP